MERWAKIRAKGRTRFIWFNGVLIWGVMTGILWAVVMAAWQDWSRLPRFLGFALVGFPIGGYFFGLLTWSFSEKRFQQALREDPDA